MKNDSFVTFFFFFSIIQYFSLCSLSANKELNKDFIRDINYSQCVLNDIAFTNETNH